MGMDLLTMTPSGLYCAAGDFYLDPWKPVHRAVLSHGHSDHAREGHRNGLMHPETAAIVRHRQCAPLHIQELAYGKEEHMNGVVVSLHPAGHIPGSSQIRVEYQGEVWVFSGDYHTHSNPVGRPFEPQRCHTFITESTFALPIYRWPDPAEEMQSIHSWWAQNRELGRCSLLIGYSLGKAQRLLSGLDPGAGPLLAHGAVYQMTEVIRELGYRLPPMACITESTPRELLRQALVLAPPSAMDSNWTKRLEPFSLAFASGWMRLRGPRRRHAADRGFVLSDHADWDGLCQAVRETGAERIGVTHGFAEVFSKWLREQGLDARPLRTFYEGESGEIREGSVPAGTASGGADDQTSGALDDEPKVI